MHRSRALAHHRLPQPGSEVIATADGGVEVREPDDLLSRLRVYDIGVVVFQTGLVLAAFQILLNQVAEDRFVEQVRLTLTQQEHAIQSAVARSLAASRSLPTLELAPTELDRVIENATALRSCRCSPTNPGRSSLVGEATSRP